MLTRTRPGARLRPGPSRAGPLAEPALKRAPLTRRVAPFVEFVGWPPAWPYQAPSRWPRCPQLMTQVKRRRRRPRQALPRPLLTTPLLSPARLPETLQDMAASRRLDVAVAAAMSAHSLGAGAAASSCAEVAQDGHVLYQDHATFPVIPASNMKLVTAAALLDKLGPSYTFQTDLRVLQPPVHGIIHGNLYLVGGGDPVLRLSSDAPSGRPGALLERRRPRARTENRRRPPGDRFGHRGRLKI